MKILVACEESQAVTIELRRLGHEAYSCDLQPCSGGYPEWHLQQDVLPLLSHNWDMIIAFPPCTYLSNAGNSCLMPGGIINEERYKRGLEAKAFFMKIFNANCSRIAIENPVHNSIFDMPAYSQQIQPFMFGHPVTKKTRLWLRGLPILMATDIVPVEGTWLPSSHSKSNGVCVTRKSLNRSKTFPGVARAMAAQWAGPKQNGV